MYGVIHLKGGSDTVTAITKSFQINKKMDTVKLNFIIIIFLKSNLFEKFYLQSFSTRNI